MIAQSIVWDSFGVHASLEGEGKRRARHIFFEKKNDQWANLGF